MVLTNKIIAVISLSTVISSLVTILLTNDNSNSNSYIGYNNYINNDNNLIITII